MIEKITGCALEGIESHKVDIEVNISRGAKYLLVGLPENAVKESHFRILAALKNNGYKIPVKEIIINLAPADLKRKGAPMIGQLQLVYFVLLSNLNQGFLKTL